MKIITLTEMASGLSSKDIEENNITKEFRTIPATKDAKESRV